VLLNAKAVTNINDHIFERINLFVVFKHSSTRLLIHYSLLHVTVGIDGMPKIRVTLTFRVYPRVDMMLFGHRYCSNINSLSCKHSRLYFRIWKMLSKLRLNF